MVNILFMLGIPVHTQSAIKPVEIKVKEPSQNEMKKYIIEIDDPTVLTQLKTNNPKIEIDKIYNTVFQGASIIAKQNDIKKLKQQPGIKNIHPTSTYKVELDQSVPFIGGDAIRGKFDSKNRRLTGKGVKIGVIDTGIDYKHPDLERNYNGGFDVVDEDHDPMETIKSQGEPTLHGTHVAGIIAANGKVNGVAPEAEIYAYRALGPGGIGTSDQVIAAIEKAVEDGMDIINLSLGSSVNGPDYPTSLALDRAVEKGVVAVTSNGNSGPALWTVGSPGTSAKAISVGASTPPLAMPYLELELTSNKPILLQPLQGSINWNLSKSYKLVDGGLGNPEELTDVKGKIVLIERGAISFTEKVINAYQKGARAVLIYNDEKGSFNGGLEKGTAIDIPAAAITQADGQFLKEQLKKGKQWMATQTRQVTDRLAMFSSRGPVTHSWGIKPDVVAPGVEIDSTVPTGYLALQGTSMAAPHVAGAAALIKQAHPNWNPEEIKAALMNTAKLLKNEKGIIYSPYEQGAGRIQIEQAVEASVLAYPASIAFGTINPTSGSVQKTIRLTIANKSNQHEKISFQSPTYQHGIQWQLPISFYLPPNEKKQIPISIQVDSKTIAKGIQYGNVLLEANRDVITIPYLFIVGDANHPRVMGFSFEKKEGTQDTYHYELYLPEGADEIGIALFDPITLKYIGTLERDYNVKRGLIEIEKKRNEFPFPNGTYHVIIYAIQNGIESIEEAEITIGKPS